MRYLRVTADPTPGGDKSPQGFDVLQKVQLPIEKPSHDDFKNPLANGEPLVKGLE